MFQIKLDNASMRHCSWNPLTKPDYSHPLFSNRNTIKLGKIWECVKKCFFLYALGEKYDFCLQFERV